MTEDMEHWASMGIKTVEDFERYSLSSSVSDIYKDVNGFRPRHMDLKNMSIEDMSDVLDSLFVQLDAQTEAEHMFAEQEEERIVRLCDEQGVDRVTYDRWMAEANQPLWV